MARLIAFSWFGGKFTHLNFILPLLPDMPYYCEPFCGSAAVFLNRKPAEVETLNDIDGEIINFFRVLRSRPEELINLLRLTPHSREEFAIAVSGSSTNLTDLERARRFFVRARQARGSRAATKRVTNWAWNRRSSRRGRAKCVSAWRGGVEKLWDVADRLLNAQIENDDAVNIINRYDTEDTLFYCDPPYPHESRATPDAYAFEMTDDQHARLADVLHSVKGKVAISGYRCPLMSKLYGDFKRIDGPIKSIPASDTRAKRQECIWINYSL